MAEKRTSLFVFRRDLRTYDNTGLILACNNSDVVYPVFILDPKQISPKTNEYFAYNSFRFMLQSLVDLKHSLPQLIIMHGHPHEVIRKLCKEYNINNVYCNEDYTPYSIIRDKLIKQTIDPANLIYATDYCFNSAHDIKPYQVYTPYYNAAKKKHVKTPQSFTQTMFNKIHKLDEKSVNLQVLINDAEKHLKPNMDLDLVQSGGRKEGLAALNSFVKNRLASYSKKRNLLTYETSRLSPHVKFGTISIREVYHACNSNIYRKELYWRDFYMQVAYHFPNTFKENYRHHIAWHNSKKHFAAWCKGETGYDIVDAAMTQLNKSGFMHNRARMIVASFLTKILHIDWRYGAKYFAQKLTDYDPSSNYGGWQWSAGTGMDAQPYFRIFNPFTQEKKFDPDREYIKKWLGDRKPIEPIVDYDKERLVALKIYRKG